MYIDKLFYTMNRDFDLIIEPFSAIILEKKNLKIKKL
ncbi:hypothetical protein WKK_04960 [Weissella koreensis KACC 15510]|nr:hypothetical protein WKK_04960 [Weissella koreensis KACC 15510]